MAQKIVVPGQQVIGVSRPPVVGVSWERGDELERPAYQRRDGQHVTPRNAAKATLLDKNGKPVAHDGGLEYFLTGAGHVVTRRAPFSTRHPVLAKAARAAGIAGMALGSLGLAGTAGAGGISSETFSSVIPLGAANADGAYGSHWTDRQLLQNPTDFELTGELCLTERGQPESEDDPCVPYTIAPHQTLVIDGLYALAKPGAQGAARVRLLPAVNQQKPVWRAQIFNQSPDGEFGMSLRPDSTLYDAGNTLEDVLSDAGYRDGLFVSTGADGATIHWTLVDAATGAVTEADAQYEPNTTVQYTQGVSQLFGTTPAPGSYVTARIDDGQAMTYLSRNNNTTSDGAWDPFTRKIIARIIGLDTNLDGKVDVIDSDGDHVLDTVIGVACNDPYGAVQYQIIAESPIAHPNYFGSGMPAGMSLHQGTGVITYDPPCSDAGQLFSPTFYISGAEFHMSIPFRVN
jgi:hypothetical protein